MVLKPETVGKWLQQVTTGHGFATAAATIAGMLTGTINPYSGIPVLIGSLILILWPENQNLSSNAERTAQDTIELAQQIAQELQKTKDKT